MLVAIFYARFLLERGPSIIAQHPKNFISITTSQQNQSQSLLSWSELSSYIIPTYDFCNRPLSLSRKGFHILGFPVSLEDEKYERNRFTFNVCFVILPEETKTENEDFRSGWEDLVRKTARFFTALEVDDGILLSKEVVSTTPKVSQLDQQQQKGGRQQGGIDSILEQIFTDINKYGETCVRVEDLHVLNLRLFRPPRPAPPRVNAWDVPLLIRSLPRPEEWTWDLTLERIHSYIDGVNHIQRIAEMADVESKLAIKAIRELLYHQRVFLLDLFHFQAVYMLTEDFNFFVADESMQDECCRYVAIDPFTNPFVDIQTTSTTLRPPHSQNALHLHHHHHLLQHHHQQQPISTPTPTLNNLPTKQNLLTLYRDLNASGYTMHTFLLSYPQLLSNIDVRKFVTFGVIKGFLRRIHKFALAVDSSVTGSLQHSPSPGGSFFTATPNGQQNTTRRAQNIITTSTVADAQEEFDRAWRRAALSSGWATPPTEPPLPTTTSGLSNSHSTQQQQEHTLDSSGIVPGGRNSPAHSSNGNNLHNDGEVLPNERRTPRPPEERRGGGSSFNAAAPAAVEEEKLKKFLDGQHCLDQICVEMHWSEKRLVENLASGRFGDVVIFSK